VGVIHEAKVAPIQPEEKLQEWIFNMLFQHASSTERQVELWIAGHVFTPGNSPQALCPSRARNYSSSLDSSARSIEASSEIDSFTSKCLGPRGSESCWLLLHVPWKSKSATGFSQPDSPTRTAIWYLAMAPRRSTSQRHTSRLRAGNLRGVSNNLT